MALENIYILSIDPNSTYDTDILIKQLDLCLDWTRLFACTYLLYTNSDIEKLYSRFKKALPDNKFFVTKVDFSNGKYTGWLGSSKWDRIKEFKNNK